MRVIRSFPQVIPPHRAYVVDELPRLINHDYDYAGLGALDDDVLLIEWDMAAGGDELADFAAHASLHPSDVLVGGHRLYHVAPEPVWAHRVVSFPAGGERWVWLGESVCDYFAFGLIYLPRDLIRQFLDAPAPARGRSPFLPPENPYEDMRFCDQTFSVWHRWQLGRRAAIDWSIHPVHLHYPLPAQLPAGEG